MHDQNCELHAKARVDEALELLRAWLLTPEAHGLSGDGPYPSRGEAELGIKSAELPSPAGLGEALMHILQANTNLLTWIGCSRRIRLVAFCQESLKLQSFPSKS